MNNLPVRRYDDCLGTTRREADFLETPLTVIAKKDKELAAGLIAGLAVTKFKIVETQENASVAIARSRRDAQIGVAGAQRDAAVGVANARANSEISVARIKADAQVATARSHAEVEKARLSSMGEVEKVKALRDTFVTMSAEVGATVRATGRPFQLKTAVKKPGFFGMKTEKEIVVRGEFLD